MPGDDFAELPIRTNRNRLLRMLRENAEFRFLDDRKPMYPQNIRELIDDYMDHMRHGYPGTTHKGMLILQQAIEDIRPGLALWFWRQNNAG